MDGDPMLSVDDELRTRMLIGGQYQAPAFVRRALGVQQVYDEMIERCRKKRDEWLRGVRLHLAFVHDAGGPLPIEDVTKSLANLRGTTEPARPLTELRASVQRFNRKWTTYVAEVDLTEVNRRRDEYNRNYLIEKECAVGSPRLAAIGFHRLAALSQNDILRVFPLLPIP
ncbi:MAG: hypothetical protein U0746_11965 [Gemmataceae bacterium]